MSTIITRAGKGSKLTHNEMDQNLTNLNVDKLEKSMYNTDNSLVIKNNAGELAEVVVAASRIVGRKASGEIVALTMAEALVMLDIQIGDVEGLTAIETNVSTLSTGVGQQLAKVTVFELTATEGGQIAATDSICMGHNNHNALDILRMPTIASCWDAGNNISKVFLVKVKTPSDFGFLLKPHSSDSEDAFAGFPTGLTIGIGSTQGYQIFTDGTFWRVWQGPV